MPYRKIKPLKPLRPFVESIWIQDDARDAAIENFEPTIILPSTKIDLLFFYRDPFVQLLDDGNEAKVPDFFLIGQRSKAIKVAATGKTGIIIFSFYPWGAAPFFRLPMHELQDCCIELNTFMNPALIGSVEQQVLEQANNHERVVILQGFLLNLLYESAHDDLIKESTFQINKENGNVAVNRLAQQYYLSRRQYIRRFKHSVGIGPKKFANIVRFQKALLLQKLGVEWTKIAEECGYYDQPHFIKEMKRFSGFSPQQVSSRTPPTKLMQYFNSGHDLSHFYNTIYL